MSLAYDQNGLQFHYPDAWSLEREESQQGWSITLQSQGTGFLLIVCDQEMPQAEEMAEATLEALRKDYPLLEADSIIENICGQPAIGHDIGFFSLDLENTCKTRCLYIQDGTLLFLSQSSDIDYKKFGPAMQALYASIKIDNE